MGETVSVNEDPLMIRYRGVYDFEGMYRMIRKFLDQKRFDVEEGRYKDKQTTAFGNEVEHKIQAQRDITDFVRYYVEVRTLFDGVNEFKAQTDEGEKTLTRGTFQIKLNAEVEFDWQNRYQSGWGKTFFDFYLNKLFWNYYKFNYIAPLENMLYELQRKVKQKADMKGAEYA